MAEMFAIDVPRQVQDTTMTLSALNGKFLCHNSDSLKTNIQKISNNRRLQINNNKDHFWCHETKY